MKFIELVNFLDSVFPKNLSEPWDSDGTEVCTDYNLEIGRILLTLDITFNVLDYALIHGFNCIISHHSMIFSPLKKLDLTTAASRKAVFLAKHDMCAVSMHTRLDAAQGGVNDALLDVIGVPLYQAEPFGNKNSESLGRIFTLTESKTVKHFALEIKNALEYFYTGNFATEVPVSVKYIEGDKDVSKVAVVSGGGIDFIEAAASTGADTFLTGEGSYNKILDAYESAHKGSRLNIITAGHFETEALVLPYLKRMILNQFPNAPVEFYIDNVMKTL